MYNAVFHWTPLCLPESFANALISSAVVKLFARQSLCQGREVSVLSGFTPACRTAEIFFFSFFFSHSTYVLCVPAALSFHVGLASQQSSITRMEIALHGRFQEKKRRVATTLKFFIKNNDDIESSLLV